MHLNINHPLPIHLQEVTPMSRGRGGGGTEWGGGGGVKCPSVNSEKIKLVDLIIESRINYVI